jgi:drug/metabolite transporter (DMT)-like permease
MQQRLEPIVLSAGAMLVAAIVTGLIAYLSPGMGGPAPARLGDLSPSVLGAVLALGVVNTFGAYLLFYPLVSVLGASRTSMVTYVIPVVGVVLGALFLGEVVDVRLLIGGVLIVGSIALVNLNFTALQSDLRLRLAARRSTQ